MNTLILDGTYLCHRAFHSTGSLSYNGQSTGTTFGFLRTLQSLGEMFQPRNVIICFDHGKGLREDKYSWYKENRRKKVYTEEEEYEREKFRGEVKGLKESVLKNLGYENVFYQTGCEADDIIASVVLSLTDKKKHDYDRDERFIIITGDHDLYQCIRRNVSVFHPASNITSGSHITKDIFESMFGVSAKQWVQVKSIAGCKTDDVPGVDGVGEQTAAKYVSGQMNEKTPTYKKIKKFIKSRQFLTNQRVVSLPYPGTKPFEIVKTTVDGDEWDKLCSSMGMDSLSSHVPHVNIRGKK